MVCGALPFEENTTKELYKKVIEGLYFIPSNISLEATEVIKKMLINDPAERLNIPKLRRLKFFTDLRTVEPKIIGIIVGFHPMPIDNEILEQMQKIMKFDKTDVENHIKENKHTQYTTMYYLTQKQSLRNGKKTIVDLQYFLETNETYKSEYGILPEECKE
jgi:serine/threonine protein kinase